MRHAKVVSRTIEDWIAEFSQVVLSLLLCFYSYDSPVMLTRSCESRGIVGSFIFHFELHLNSLSILCKAFFMNQDKGRNHTVSIRSEGQHGVSSCPCVSQSSMRQSGAETHWSTHLSEMSTRYLNDDGSFG